MKITVPRSGGALAGRHVRLNVFLNAFTADAVSSLTSGRVGNTGSSFVRSEDPCFADDWSDALLKKELPTGISLSDPGADFCFCGAACWGSFCSFRSGALLSSALDACESEEKSNTFFSLAYCSDVMVFELAQTDDASEAGQSAFWSFA
ncbi:MAG: hypothetical protein Q9196_002160 [Gyalolechia fulgens]